VAKVVITHNVADVEKWLGFKAERAAAIGSLGGTNVQDCVAADGGNTVAITCDMEDVESALATLGSPPAEMAQAMQGHGVLPPLVAYVAHHPTASILAHARCWGYNFGGIAGTSGTSGTIRDRIRGFRTRLGKPRAAQCFASLT
jgi:hypothetical protein